MTKRVERVFVVAVLLMIAALCLQRIWSVDYWWQWKTGESVLRDGPPRRDLFSFTNPDHARIEVRWLYCAGLHALTNALGHGAATLVKCAWILATFWLAVRLGARRGWHAGAWAVAGVAALACSQRLVVRPETASYGLLIATIAIVVRLQSGRSRWAFVLPGVVALWANLHGLFVLGPAVVGAWWTAEAIEAVWERRHAARDAGRGRRLRTATILLGAALVAPLLNPYGARIWVLAVDQFRTLQDPMQRSFYAELASPFAFVGQGFTAIVFYEILIGLVVVAAIAAGRRLRLFWWIVVAPQLVLSMTAIRNLPLFALVAVPFVVRGLASSRWMEGRRRRGALRVAPVPAMLLGIAAALFVVRDVATDRFAVRQHDTNQFGLGIAAHRFPVGAVEFLRAHAITGPLFNPPGAGSYLLAHGFEVFIDPRGEVYQDRILAEYRRLVDAPRAATIAEYTERWGLRAMVLDPDMFVLARAAESAGWRIVYADAESIVLLHADVVPEVAPLALERNGEAWLAAQRRNLPQVRAATGFRSRVTQPAPYARLARLAWELGAPRTSCALYADAHAADAKHFRDWSALGWCAEQARDHKHAARYFARAVELQPRDEALLKRAAFACLLADSIPAARAFAETLLAVADDDSPALQVLASAMLKERRADDAAALLERAVKQDAERRDRSTAITYLRLGQARCLQGRWTEAKQAFEEATTRDTTNVQAAQWLGRVMERLGDGPRAHHWYTRAATLEARAASDSVPAP
jgi:tetratricopeptide (TPR) repeat protein